ncbi:GntR family transcriptional regulator [Microbacterium sp. W4I20]|uniref:GntR family transcriptional regulator n=1 Tax=Microbacterium sp. W4I20 TaxID=3042262 RepID=UPI0027D92710|nr:GntR family transcriptional regulator [Microbacterium sp. W4I20]
MDDADDPLPIPPRELIRDQVFAMLAEEIVSGRLLPLEEIRAQDLQADFGVSRTPIREALTRLADLGLIEVSTNRFTRVAPIDLFAQADRVEAAAAMVGYAALAVIPTYSDTQIAAFDTRIEELLAFDLTLAGSREVRGHWYGLWGSLVLATGNRTMIEILDGQLALHLTRTIPRQRTPQDIADFLRESLEELREIVRRRDAAPARLLIEEIFQRSSIDPLREAARAVAGTS